MTGSLAATPANDDFFQDALFKGAFCSEGVWTNGWTAVDAYGVLADNLPTISIQNGSSADCFVVGVEDLVIANKGYKLMQNTPNPVANSTQISFELPKSTEISLVIYDITGRIVATPVNKEHLQAGLNSIDIDGSNLQAGLYYYTLTNNEVSISKRMVK